MHYPHDASGRLPADVERVEELQFETIRGGKQ